MKPEKQLGQVDSLARPMELRFARAYRRLIDKLRPKVLANVRAGRAPDVASGKAKLPRAFASIYRNDIEAARAHADKQITGAPAPAKTFFVKARRRLSDLEEGASREVGVAGTRRLPYATGVTFNVGDLIDASLERLGGTLDTLDDRLELVLADAPEDATDEELADLIDEEFDLFQDEGKIEGIAETEVFGSVNGGRAQAFEDNDIEWATWGTMEDSKVRETHRDFGSSGVHPIGFNYATLTDTPETLLRWPHDVECEEASLVVNCRCALLWTDPPANAEDIYDDEMGDLGEEGKAYKEAQNQPRDEQGRWSDTGAAARVGTLEGELATSRYEPSRWEPVRGRQGPPSPEFARHRVHLELSHLRRDIARVRGEEPRSRPGRAPEGAPAGAPGAAAQPRSGEETLRDLASLSTTNVQSDASWHEVADWLSGTSAVGGRASVTPAEAEQHSKTLAALIGAPPGSRVRISDVNGTSIRIQFSKNTATEQYDAERVLTKNAEGIVSSANNSFAITKGPESLGMDVFDRQVRALTAMNEGRGGTIITHGVGSPSMGVARMMGDTGNYSNGYYTWARFGYESKIGEESFKVPPVAARPGYDRPMTYVDPRTGQSRTESPRTVWEREFLNADGQDRATEANKEIARRISSIPATPFSGSRVVAEVERVRTSVYMELIGKEYAKLGRPRRMSELRASKAMWFQKAFGMHITGEFSLKKDSESQLTLAAYRAERAARKAKKAALKKAVGTEPQVVQGEWTPDIDVDDEAFLDLIGEFMTELPPEMVDDPEVAAEVVRRIHAAYTDPDYKVEGDGGEQES